MKYLIALVVLVLVGINLFAKSDYVSPETSELPLVLGNTIFVTGYRLETRTYYDIISQYDWCVRTAYAVMMAESRANPKAVNWRDIHHNCRGSFGLFQLACFRGGEEMYDPETNIQMAYELWQREGWKPWGAYTDGNYLKFLYN